MNRILDEQLRRNLASRDSWERFAPHRNRITQLLQLLAKDGEQRLCVLGAGNCNDLDLVALADSFTQITLVDWDSNAVQEGMAKQPLSAESRARIVCLGGIDVSGVGSILANWSPAAPPPDSELQKTLAAIDVAQPMPEAGPFDVVVSVCTLSQLLDGVLAAIGERHPRLLEFVVAIRSRHLRLMAELAAPGGLVALITDIVSSLTYPLLAQTPLEQLPATLGGLIQQRNFFTGLNPCVLESLFRTDARLAALVSDVRSWPPWLWDFGPRVYAVCAFTARRR